MKEKWVIFVLFGLSLFLRLFRLADYPAGFTADEAAQGYTAYSILKTGQDEWGVKFPLTPRSFGDFKAPLYTYLTIPSIMLFGLDEFSVRFPNAIFGSLAIIVVYFLIKELLNEGFGQTEEQMINIFPLLASFFLAINPWHVSLSRGAFEANLTTFFLPAAVLFFLKSLKSPKFLLLSSLFFGLNLFTYHSAKVVTPLILFFLFLWKKEKIKNNLLKNKWTYIGSATILLLLVSISGMSFLSGAGSRVTDIGLLSSGWQTVAEQRFFSVQRGLPDTVSRIFNNKAVFVLSEFFKSFFSYLSLHFLFSQGAGEATYGMLPGKGLLYLFELPFILTAFYLLFKEKKPLLVFLWFWILVSPIPAALSRGVGYHANRVAVMMPAIQIISAYGAIRILNFLKEKKERNFLVFGWCLGIFFSLLFFFQSYFFQSPRMNALKMSYGWRSTRNYLNNVTKKIVISRTLSEPQAFVMFYWKMDPKKVQTETPAWKEYEKKGLKFVDQLGKYSLANFEFRNFSFPEDWREGNVLVGTPADFAVQKKWITDEKSSNFNFKEQIINFPDNSPAIVIYGL